MKTESLSDSRDMRTPTLPDTRELPRLCQHSRDRPDSPRRVGVTDRRSGVQIIWTLYKSKKRTIQLMDVQINWTSRSKLDLELRIVQSPNSEVQITEKLACPPPDDWYDTAECCRACPMFRQHCKLGEVIANHDN